MAAKTTAVVTVTRKNRQTGTTATATREKDVWLTKCEDHDATATHKS